MATINIDIDKAKVHIKEIIFNNNVTVSDITDQGISCDTVSNNNKQKRKRAKPLSDKIKDAIAKFFYFEHLKRAEIARYLGLPWYRVDYFLFPEKYVKRNMRYLRRKLKEFNQLQAACINAVSDGTDIVNISINKLKCTIDKIVM